MKAIIDDKIPYIRGLIEQLVDEVVYLPGSAIGASDVHDADILLVRTRTRCDRALLAGSQVRCIITATIGYDHIDTDYMREAGIVWTNCPGCNASSVRQYVHNSLLALDLLHEGMTVGVVGVGHVGSLVANDLEQNGLHVLRCDPPKGLNIPMEVVAETCDIITFHTPLTTDGPCPTYHLADDAFFRSLRRQPVIINSSRGAVVDNAAWLLAIRSGQVRASIIDTWEGEPAINLELLQAADIATPHIAGYSADGKSNATRMTLEAVCQFLHKPFTLTVEAPTLPSDFAYGHITTGPLRLYDPRIDSQKLKSHPEQFEWLRGNYPLRREKR